MKPKDNAEAFQLVVERIRSKTKTPPLLWLQQKLGVSRQTIYRYSKTGFDQRQIDRLSQLTGLPPHHIKLPNALPVDFPSDIEAELIIRAKAGRVSFRDYVVSAIKDHLRRSPRK